MIKHLYRYSVYGVGQFPVDMLRYDSCWPDSQSDTAKISLIFRYTSEEGDDRDRSLPTGVTVTGVSMPTVARWASFGWHVSGSPVVIKL